MSFGPPFKNMLSIAAALAFSLTIRSALAASYIVPSASMEPTLMIGDHVGVVVPAYGLSTANLPYGNLLHRILPSDRRIWSGVPVRGDVVVFRAPANPSETWVKRVIGIPGDRIALRGGRVFLNGQLLPWRDEGPVRAEISNGDWVEAERYDETLPGNRHHQILKLQQNAARDEVKPFTVPQGRVFVMGDDRDNSADSRFSVSEGGVGLLPMWNLTGRVERVLWSWRHPCRLFVPVG